MDALWGVTETERARTGVGPIIALNRLRDVIQKEYGNEILLTINIC